MIKNMTIEQLLQSDVVEEVDEAIHMLLNRLNELNTADYKIGLCMYRNVGKIPIPIIYDKEKGDVVNE